MRFTSLFLVLFLLSSTSLAAKSPSCKVVIKNSQIQLNHEFIPDLLAKPQKYLDKKFIEKKPTFGTPFKIVSHQSLPAHLKKVVSDINLLSQTPELREKVFGSSTKYSELITSILPQPLNLKKDSRYYLSQFVEVGVEVFTLDDFTHRYVYSTSNHKSSIQVPYEFFSSIINEIKKEGRTVVALDSFHTHPLNLLPTLSDREYFTNELELVKQNHPEVSFREWKMRTVMDESKYLHEVDLADWHKTSPK